MLGEMGAEEESSDWWRTTKADEEVDGEIHWDKQGGRPRRAFVCFILLSVPVCRHTANAP